MTRYHRASNSGHTVEWKPDDPIPDGSGGEIHPAHGRATALYNVLSNVSKVDITDPDFVADVDNTTAEQIREEFRRLVENPADILTDIVSP